MTTIQAISTIQSFTPKRYAAFLVAILMLAIAPITPAFAQLQFTEEALTVHLLDELEQHLEQPLTRKHISAREWRSYSTHIMQALASDHDGLQQAALRMIILYGANIDVHRDDIVNILKLYREHYDDRLRRMAVVALGQTGDSFALSYLNRSAAFEKSKEVQRTIHAVLASQHLELIGPAKAGS